MGVIINPADMSETFIGARVGASLMSGEATGRIPTSGGYIVVGVRGEAVAIGARGSFENGLLTVGKSFGFGGGFIIGFVPRE